ncbi:MAG: triose-phosphate isomerase [Candidatus Hydrogenedentes bacterium]|nr:triose-phosphate isomerase [Candidatus Hydrogenedentota bacterium]
MSTARKPLVAGNWKLNKLVGEAVATVEALKPLVADVSNVDIVVCPVYTALHAAAQAAAGSNVEVGAQNAYNKENGAFTGEISPQMIKDTGCTWVIIGHSERRQYFGEGDALLNEKLHFALGTGLKVMFCIGETLEEREGGKMDDVLTRQITEGLKGVSEAQFANVAIAYEPVWAIGTGVTASPEQAESAHLFVRDLVRKLFGDAVADGVRIQYGGSAKPGNAAELISQPNVDGFLVGGAALQADSFAGIITAVSAHG